MSRRVAWALAILVAGGLVLRVAIWFAYDPTPLFFNDSLAFVNMANGALFADATHTVGYSLFLDALHALSETIAAVVSAQHLLGIATGLLVFAAFNRIDAPGWVALVAAGAVLLSLDQVMLEHSLLSEAPFAFVLAIVLYAAVRALDEPRALAGPVTSRMAWVAGAALALGFAAWLRPVALPLIPLLAVWVGFAVPGPWRPRLAHAAIALAASVLVILGYAVLEDSKTGEFGFGRASGWTMYSRVAPFADCSQFNPPAETEALCEDTPADDRYGPDFYGQHPDSPARRLFGGPPYGDHHLREFARSALLAQPLDYLGDVAADSIRYFVPSAGERPYGGGGYEVIDIDRGAPAPLVAELATGLGSYYSDADVRVGGLVAELATLQDVLRIQPWLMALVIALGIAGVVLARGRTRAALVLAFGASLALMLIPPATAIWSARYAVPVTGPLAGCAAAGAWLVVARLSTRRSRG